MNDLTDGELMALVREGDLVAFDALYDRYRDRVYRFLFSLTWDDQEAEDYLQETFLRLYQARDRYVETGSLSTYLMRIATNHFRWQRRKRRCRNDVPMLPPMAAIRANASVEPDVQLLAGYERWRIRRAIEALPEGRRLVFVMAHLEDMKYAEIAEVLGIPVGTVKSRMAAAVRSLRATLEEGMR
jgi:RNA polymerase sigma-70 factor, ECF subfamily